MEALAEGDPVDVKNVVRVQRQGCAWQSWGVAMIIIGGGLLIAQYWFLGCLLVVLGFLIFLVGRFIN